MKTMLIRTALLGTVLALPGGVLAQQGPTTVSRPPDGRENIPVQVTNNGWLDVGVYAVVAGVPQYLGEVPGLSSGQLKLAADWVSTGDVRLLADPIGGFGHYLTEPLRPLRGDLIQLRLEDDLRFSTVDIRSTVSSG